MTAQARKQISPNRERLQACSPKHPTRFIHDVCLGTQSATNQVIIYVCLDRFACWRDNVFDASKNWNIYTTSSSMYVFRWGLGYHSFTRPHSFRKGGLRATCKTKNYTTYDTQQAMRKPQHEKCNSADVSLASVGGNAPPVNSQETASARKLPCGSMQPKLRNRRVCFFCFRVDLIDYIFNRIVGGLLLHCILR